MSISKTQLKSNRIQGIHFSEVSEKDQDLVYSYSDFYTNGLAAAVDTVKKTPLVGPDASDLGPKLYMRGTTWDANHMDRFINSNVNKRLSYTPIKVSMQNPEESPVLKPFTPNPTKNPANTISGDRATFMAPESQRV